MSALGWTACDCETQTWGRSISSSCDKAQVVVGWAGHELSGGGVSGQPMGQVDPRD